MSSASFSAAQAACVTSPLPQVGPDSIAKYRHQEHRCQTRGHRLDRFQRITPHQAQFRTFRDQCLFGGPRIV